MTTRRIRNDAEARECLAAAAASGLPRAAWAKVNGIDARSLNAWRINLERSGESITPRLVELVPRALRPPVPVTYVVRCGPFEVQAPAAFDDESLGRLLRVVASC